MVEWSGVVNGSVVDNGSWVVDGSWGGVVDGSGFVDNRGGVVDGSGFVDNRGGFVDGSWVGSGDMVGVSCFSFVFHISDIAIRASTV